MTEHPLCAVNKAGKTLVVFAGVVLWNAIGSFLAISVFPHDQFLANLLGMVLGMPGGAVAVLLYWEWIEPPVWKGKI
ncbi:hypothetical protein [Acidiferrobacter sp.]|uniref:hypothetical protein n=1 Tax=Acidiferrobacter sp. TaxID=1872107 RepID=UPI00261AB1C6|nr:hypothetical protein [Acidiferrobacter sp.]